MAPTKYYLAALGSRAEEMRGYKAQLEAQGHRVTSTWHDQLDYVPGTIDYEDVGAYYEAQRDLAQVAWADALILFTEPRGSKLPGGGRFVEFGIAVGMKRKTYIVGPVENLLLKLATAGYENFAEFLYARCVNGWA
jgi:hypothetical protein